MDNILLNAHNHPSLKNVLSAWQLDISWLERCAAAAANKDLVTFDIFDTALTRDVESSFDIFAQVEQKLAAANKNFVGFAAAREQAEAAANVFVKEQKGFEEITFAEIYEILPQFLKLSAAEIEQAKASELQEEERTLCAVPDILAAAKYLSQAGITYSFVSDMYLPQDFLEKILRREGYQNWQSCIVSSAVRVTKHCGNIWNISYLRGKKILHIGDNPHADIIQPRKAGVETLLYARAQSHRRYGAALTPAILPFSRAHRLAELAAHSIPSAYAAPSEEEQKNQHKKEMYALGQSFGAIILGSFIFWLQERAKIHQVTHLAFCARDGFLMRQAWHILTKPEDTGISDSYLRVSRKVLTLGEAALISAPAKTAPVIIDFLSQYERHTSIGDIVKRLAEFSPQTAEKAAKILGHPSALLRRKGRVEKLRRFLRQESAQLYEDFQKKYKEAVGYLTQEGLAEHKKLAIVDMGWRGTLQRGLARLCKSINPDFSCVGFYYGIWSQASAVRLTAGVLESAFWGEFTPPQTAARLWQGVCILENLHSSAEGSTERYRFREGQWQAVCKNSAEETKIFQNIIIPFQQGALEALRQLAETGQTETGITKNDLTTESALAAYLAISLSPTSAEIAALGQIIHSANYDHNCFIPLITPRLPWLRARYQHNLWGQEWRMAQMRHWLNIARNSHKKRALKRVIKQEFHYLNDRELHYFY